MQTFLRNWWMLHSEMGRKKYPYDGCWVGEFHARFHQQDADDRWNKAFIYTPIFMHFNVKALSGDKVLMKQQALREHWTLVILCAGVRWLRTLFTGDELQDMPKILQSVKKNLPAHHFIGFLFYFANHIFKSKMAVRTSDLTYLNFMWKYSLMMYADTGKNQYKKGCLMVLKILHDSEPKVQKILEHARIYSESGRPCSGMELDMMEERVPRASELSDAISYSSDTFSSSGKRRVPRCSEDSSSFQAAEVLGGIKRHASCQPPRQGNRGRPAPREDLHRRHGSYHGCPRQTFY
jgi:hypothetical protein